MGGSKCLNSHWVIQYIGHWLMGVHRKARTVCGRKRVSRVNYFTYSGFQLDLETWKYHGILKIGINITGKLYEN